MQENIELAKRIVSVIEWKQEAKEADDSLTFGDIRNKLLDALGLPHEWDGSYDGQSIDQLTARLCCLGSDALEC